MKANAARALAGACWRLPAGVTWQADPYVAAKDADLLVILTEWNEFRALDLKALAAGMKTPKLGDLRNIYSAEDAKAAGFEAYAAIGRQGYPD